MQWSTDLTYDSTENILGADLLKKWSTDYALHLKKTEKYFISFKRQTCESKIDEVEDTFTLSLEITTLVDYFQKYLINI